MTTLFIDVILPLAVPNLFTYRVPQQLNEAVRVGQRVVVPFGGKREKTYSAIVRKIHQNPPEKYEAKYIDAILDEKPIAHETQLRFWEWISRYYSCTIGEVMGVALPSSLKLASETRVVLHPDFNRNYNRLTDKELLIVEALEVREILDTKEIGEILGQKTIYPVIKSLLQKGAVLIEEELKERFRPKVVEYVELTPEANDEEQLKIIFDELGAAHRQLEMLMKFIELNQRYSNNPKPVLKTVLQKSINATSTLTNQLVKKNVFRLVKTEVGRLDNGRSATEEYQLSEIQQKAFDQIKNLWKEKNCVLLHGVTSSGKTQIYNALIKEHLKAEKQILFLLPEIALTGQLVNRLQKQFGSAVGVYHSKFNQNERVEIWNKVLENKNEDYRIIIGARSALYLPFSNLGLIIVDEEHENTFKQYDPAPRYHARDASLVLANLHSAKVLLGSATPSIESYFNAQTGKYGFVELHQRYGNVQMPEILISDVKKETADKTMHSHFSSFLLKEIQDALDKKEQIILFQNRRGYTPLWSCQSCGWMPGCTRCDVKLTYHKFAHLLKCHYCGYSLAPPKQCEACGSNSLKMLGFGTEKIEEELQIFLPDARIARMDLDTTRSKHAHENIIMNYENREIDILVGTQMVAKGLDFENVSLVGILHADSMLNFPDFRAMERAFQLMTQVAGRAGRKNKKGKVIIQTFQPEHWLLHHVVRNDYQKMYSAEITEREKFNYPPYTRLIQLTLKHKESTIADKAAVELTELLKSRLGNRILGPSTPFISRIRNYYLRTILIKIEKKANPNQVKSIVREKIQEVSNQKPFKSLRVVVDVDPY